MHLYSPETVANNEKRRKYTKRLFTKYPVQTPHTMQSTDEIVFSLRKLFTISLGILKLNINEWTPTDGSRAIPFLVCDKITAA